MPITTKLEDLRAMLAANLAERAAKEARVDELVAAVETRSDKTPTADEVAELNGVRAAVATLDTDRKSLTDEIDAAAARAAARAEAEAAARALPTTPISTTAGGIVTVRSNEATYRQGGQHSFFKDLYARDFLRHHNPEAAERLYRSELETKDAFAKEQRDIVVGTMAGAIPPKYLLDQFAPIARAGRPFLNALNSQPLPPDFLTTVIPRATTGTVAAPVVEGAGFNEVDMVVTNDTPTVQLIGDQQDVSRALFERGGYVIDGIIFPDLIAAVELNCDLTALQGRNNTTSILGPLAVSGVNSVSYTDASPTVPELWPKLMDAIQRVNSNRNLPATAIFMHPRRWGWITAALDTQNRPLFNFSTQPPEGPNTMALGEAAKYGQIVGTLGGLPVITDASIPTTWASGVFSTSGTEDVIIIARTTDFVLWEDDVMRFTFEQTPSTAPGQVRLAAGRFTFDHFNRYPTGISLVVGTGLVTPTF